MYVENIADSSIANGVIGIVRDYFNINNMNE